MKLFNEELDILLKYWNDKLIKEMNGFNRFSNINKIIKRLFYIYFMALDYGYCDVLFEDIVTVNIKEDGKYLVLNYEDFEFRYSKENLDYYIEKD